MGMFICIVSILGLLFYWHILLNFMGVVSLKWARRYLDRHVSAMAAHLFKIAGAYAGLKIISDTSSPVLLPSPALIVSNHQSLVDIPVLINCFPDHSLRFVAKKELKHGFPGVSPSLRIQQHALINRKGEFSATLNELKRIGRMSRRGISPVIFPEGTRSRDGIVRRFHTGAIRKILGENSLPIISVAIDGGYLFAGARGIVKYLKNGIYRVKILRVYDAPGSKGRISEIIDSCEQEIRAQVQAWKT